LLFEIWILLFIREMIDITHKATTLRIATAQAVVQVSKKETIAAIENDTVPKGNVFAMSRGLRKHQNSYPIVIRCLLSIPVLIFA